MFHTVLRWWVRWKPIRRSSAANSATPASRAAWPTPPPTGSAWTWKALCLPAAAPVRASRAESWTGTGQSPPWSRAAAGTPSPAPPPTVASAKPLSLSKMFHSTALETIAKLQQKKKKQQKNWNYSYFFQCNYANIHSIFMKINLNSS